MSGSEYVVVVSSSKWPWPHLLCTGPWPVRDWWCHGALTQRPVTLGDRQAPPTRPRGSQWGWRWFLGLRSPSFSGTDVWGETVWWSLCCWIGSGLSGPSPQPCYMDSLSYSLSGAKIVKNTYQIKYTVHYFKTMCSDYTIHLYNENDMTFCPYQRPFDLDHIILYISQKILKIQVWSTLYLKVDNKKPDL